MEQVEDDLYAVRYSVQIEVTLTSETVPFIYPNQYVWYNAESAVVSASNALVQNLTEEEIVETCYRFVVKNLTYDTKKALNVESGYLPDADETLESKTGICFDYTVLLAAMLRAQGIPARVMIGMVSPENLYHAWNSVYLDGEWIWMDATLDGTGHKERDYVVEKIY
jgi:transglutaminase-like putative cysteine protease